MNGLANAFGNHVSLAALCMTRGARQTQTHAREEHVSAGVSSSLHSAQAAERVFDKQQSCLRRARGAGSASADTRARNRGAPASWRRARRVCSSPATWTSASARAKSSVCLTSTRTRSTAPSRWAAWCYRCSYGTVILEGVNAWWRARLKMRSHQTRMIKLCFLSHPSSLFQKEL